MTRIVASKGMTQPRGVILRPLARHSDSYLTIVSLIDDQVKHLKTVQAVETLDADCLNLLANTGKNDYFSVIPATTMRDVMTQISNGTKEAVRYLLALGIIRFHANTSAEGYAYHWTDFGRAVLKKLGIR